jgi:hypothetical protein
MTELKPAAPFVAQYKRNQAVHEQKLADLLEQFTLAFNKEVDSRQPLDINSAGCFNIKCGKGHILLRTIEALDQYPAAYSAPSGKEALGNLLRKAGYNRVYGANFESVSFSVPLPGDGE